MVLVENKVNDRRDRQIQEAIDVRNWRQALSLCEKRLKKGEKSDHLSVCLCTAPLTIRIRSLAG